MDVLRRFLYLYVIAAVGVPTAVHAQQITAAGQPAQLDVRAAGDVSIRVTLKPLGFRDEFPENPAIAQRAYRARVIARHVALIREHFAERFALIQLKKHLSWYTEGLGHARECRAAIFQTRTPDEVWDTFQRYWERSAPAEAPLLQAATA